MRLTEPQFFYHVTDKNWGQKKQLLPRDNNCAGVWCRDSNEPNTARICVCPTVAKCISAIEMDREHRIYRTLRPCRARYPRRVLDSRITTERWLVRPTAFVLVGFLSEELIRDIVKPVDFIFGSDGRDLELQKEYYKWVCLNLIQMIEADSDSRVKSGVILV